MSLKLSMETNHAILYSIAFGKSTIALTYVMTTNYTLKKIKEKRKCNLVLRQKIAILMW